MNRLISVIKKKEASLLIPVLILLLSLIAATPGFTSRGHYFNDNFEMGAYNWEQVSGQWQVINGEFTQLIHPSAIRSWATAGSMSWLDYDLEVKVRALDDDGYIYLAGRWQSQNNHYGLEYFSGPDGAGSAILTLYRMVNGVRVNLGQHSPAPYIGSGNEDKVTLRISFKGANIVVFANGQQVISAADTGLNFGRIALGELNRQVFFDDVVVYDNTPPEVYGLNVVNITGTTAGIVWETNEPASALLEYGTSTAYGNVVRYSQLKIEHRINLSGLAVNTQYHYRLTVVDAAGNSFSTGNLTFSTSGVIDNTPPEITDIDTQNLDPTTTLIVWNTDELANSTVEYGLAPGVYAYSISYPEHVAAHAVLLENLRGNTTYYFRVLSRDVAGNLAASAGSSFTTDISYLPRVTKVDTDGDRVTIHWAGNPDVDEYNFYLSTTGEFSVVPDATVNETGAAKYSRAFSGLSLYVNYFIKVEGYKAEEEGEEGTDGGSDSLILRVFPPGPNPHGHYTDNPSLCGNCHAAHMALGPRLILETTPTRLCLTCHDGTQSKYDVVNGRVKKAGGGYIDAPAGPYGSIAGFGGEVAVTSRHNLNIPNKYAPGSNITNLVISEANLACGTCHNPHGNSNYRNLRQKLRFSIADVGGDTIVEAYAVTGPASEQVTYVGGAVRFCGNCHSDFHQTRHSGSIPVRSTEQPGFAISLGSYDLYMHTVGVSNVYQNRKGQQMTPPPNLPYEDAKIICQTCHYAHGTTKMGNHINRRGYSTSALKRFDFDQGCEGCHRKTDNP